MSFLDLSAEKGRIRVLVTADAGPLLDVTRQHPSGRILDVRGMSFVPLSGGQFLGYDFEAPIGIPVTYLASVYDPSDTSTPLDVSNAAMITWMTDSEWLKDPLEPVRNIPVRIQNITFLYTSPTGVFPVQGRPEPITIGDVRQAAHGEVTFLTLDQNERDRLQYITSSGHVLLLQSTQGSGVGNMYIAPTGDLQENRFAPLRDSQEREWVLPYQEVKSPVGAAGAFITWADVAAQYDTWQDIADAFPDWVTFIESLDSVSAGPILAWRGA